MTIPTVKISIVPYYRSIESNLVYVEIDMRDSLIFVIKSYFYKLQHGKHLQTRTYLLFISYSYFI
jgi:hypothetical protein